MADIGLSAFSLFFLRSERSFSYRRWLEESCKISDCRTPFGTAKIPTNNRIRSMLDPVHPSLTQPAIEGESGKLEDRAAGARGRRLNPPA